MKSFNQYEQYADMEFLREYCLREGTIRHFDKGEVVVRRGGKIKFMGVVVKGYFKYTVTDNDGNAHVTGFVFGGGIVGDFLSTVGADSVGADITAATTADVMACDLQTIKRLFIENPDEFRAFAIGLFRHAYMQYLDLHTKSPKERYMALLKRCPDILNHISLKEMSSYLCITPTHLSRIRRELTFGG
ncbi:Crp/Fnr family transcriptional regulator [Prevotella sp. PCHR]|uniref:Crp/Fnr family transcriptional regulator n=1 Tax=Xylanibacter caecicola TaxID=2736294 RepID=A0ABX2B2C8_9BACT|nr:Crp/Fnr family transcriptional regulator [Xylanibacter caecicola]NPE24259.1 Crp/Fnr family transcriptional regulator [Xylanibacter caecicola]